jgi:hypothetical protein
LSVGQEKGVSAASTLITAPVFGAISAGFEPWLYSVKVLPIATVGSGRTTAANVGAPAARIVRRLESVLPAEGVGYVVAGVITGAPDHTICAPDAIVCELLAPRARVLLDPSDSVELVPSVALPLLPITSEVPRYRLRNCFEALPKSIALSVAGVRVVVSAVAYSASIIFAVASGSPVPMSLSVLVGVANAVLASTSDAAMSEINRFID